MVGAPMISDPVQQEWNNLFDGIQSFNTFPAPPPPQAGSSTPGMQRLDGDWNDYMARRLFPDDKHINPVSFVPTSSTTFMVDEGAFHNYLSQGAFSQGGSQGAYNPPPQGAFYPPQGAYNPSQGAFNQGASNPSHGAYSPSQGAYSPSQGAFDPSQQGQGVYVSPAAQNRATLEKLLIKENPTGSSIQLSWGPAGMTMVPNGH